MKTIPPAAAIALALPPLAAPAFASTDCLSSVASITIETGSKNARYVVSLESGVSFALTPKDANAGPIMGMASLSQTWGGS